jgi:hypothetical protein
MEQPIEVLKFSRLGRNAAAQTKTAVERVAGHTRQALGSFNRGTRHPMSEQSAKSLCEVRRALDRLRIALDAAAQDLTNDVTFYDLRIEAAEEALGQAELMHVCDRTGAKVYGSKAECPACASWQSGKGVR